MEDIFELYINFLLDTNIIDSNPKNNYYGDSSNIINDGLL